MRAILVFVPWTFIYRSMVYPSRTLQCERAVSSRRGQHFSTLGTVPLYSLRADMQTNFYAMCVPVFRCAEKDIVIRLQLSFCENAVSAE